MKTKRLIVIFVICIVLIFLGIFLRAFFRRVHFNDQYVNGNTAGNLYNAGLFCENSGSIFFANPDDNNSLYSMDSNGRNLKKLCNDSAMYINADSNYVYYVRNNQKNNMDYAFFSYNNNSLCRISRNGGNAVLLDEAPCIYASLLGNYIYYLHYDTETATTLYRIKIDGTEKKQIFPYYVFNCNTIGQYFYYNGSQTDANIYQYDTNAEEETLFYNCNAYKPTVIDANNIYYMDVNQNCALVHANSTKNSLDVITSDSVDTYNLYGSNIFYQKFDKKNPALCMVKTDGSEKKDLISGTFSNINVTSYFVFFMDYQSKEIFYTSTTNPGEITVFHPGIK